MLIKKKYYTYKITLYPANQNSTLSPVKFFLSLDDVEVNFSQHSITYNTISKIQVPGPSEYKVTLRNIKKSIAIEIISLVSKAFNCSITSGWGTMPERINIEIKRRSEIITVYNVMVKSEFPYYNTFTSTCSIEFSGEYANCTYLC